MEDSPNSAVPRASLDSVTEDNPDSATCHSGDSITELGSDSEERSTGEAEDGSLADLVLSGRVEDTTTSEYVFMVAFRDIFVEVIDVEEADEATDETVADEHKDEIIDKVQEKLDQLYGRVPIESLVQTDDCTTNEAETDTALLVTNDGTKTQFILEADNSGSTTSETETDTALLITRERIEVRKNLIDRIPKSKRDLLDYDIKSEEHLRLISNVLTDGWEVKPILLELKTNPDVNDILSEHKKPPQQRYAALEKWRNRAEKPTYKSLLIICVKGEWKDSADQIVYILNDDRLSNEILTR